MLRLWDTRKTKQPLESYNAQGGIWRIRQPQNTQKHQHIVGLACMHNGFQTLNVKDDGKIEKLFQYDQHQSLAYGLDFRSNSTTQDKLQVASCSFYDCLLKVWSMQLNKDGANF